MTANAKLTHIKFEGSAWKPPVPPDNWQSVGANLRDGLMASPIVKADYETGAGGVTTVEVRFADGRVERTVNQNETAVVGYFMQKQLEHGSRSRK